MIGKRTPVLIIAISAVLALVWLAYTNAERRKYRRIQEDLQSHLHLIHLVPPSLSGMIRHDGITPLLRAGADVRTKGTVGQTVLMFSAFAGLPDAVKLCLAAGVDVNERDNYGATALLWSGASDRPDIARLLIARGAEVDARNNDGTTPLAFASHYGQVEVARVLLESGADPDARTASGHTPLMAAATGFDPTRTCLTIAKLLLDHGADPALKNNAGDTAYSLARSKGNKEIARLLKKRMALHWLRPHHPAGSAPPAPSLRKTERS